MVTAKRGQSRGMRPDSTALSKPHLQARQDLAMQPLIIIDQMLSNIPVESHYTITCVMSSFGAHTLLLRHFKFICCTSTSLNKIACKPSRLDHRPMRTKKGKNRPVRNTMQARPTASLSACVRYVLKEASNGGQSLGWASKNKDDICGSSRESSLMHTHHKILMHTEHII